MEIVAREGGNALSGPRPVEWSTGPYAPQGPDRNGNKHTSRPESPMMLLTGHQSVISTMKFNPARTIIASGSHRDCKNFMVLKGHKNAVLDLHWTIDGSQIISARPDSDDGTAKLWDMRQRGAIQTFPDKYQITAVIEVSMTLQGHQDMITVVPIFSLMIFEGHQHNFEKNLLKCGWSPDGSKDLLTKPSSILMNLSSVHVAAINRFLLGKSELLQASGCIFLTLSLRLLPSLCGFFFILLHAITIAGAVTGCSVAVSGSNRFYAAHMVVMVLTSIFQGSVSVLILTRSSDFLGYLKSYVREDDGIVILKLVGGLCVTVFCLEWMVLGLGFVLRYYAFVEGHEGVVNGGQYQRNGKVQV
ncbi:hypothetical protein Goklo_015263 [Gossypium klotzschianum]|uniref:Uncharacterized protein n=1 Tax=Gossypium klotzschianum TaxID=34286 RepID=A0A7J8UAN7_9ROSI|nr:hypothetical protein [Gossypium klotzschianum]